jgi:16S rRNA (guanine527-N7)-methyltransferase
MSLSAEQEARLRELLHVFLEENKQLNLSAYRTEATCWTGNILDSLPVLPLLSGVKTVLDLGTGGGFPLLPLALLLPEVKFTGLDSVKKKIDAVQRIVNTLGLPNVQLLVGRAEELGHDETHRERYDMALSRAVADLSTLLEFCSPFVRVGGKIICWKSLSIEEELKSSVNARMQLQCRLIDHLEYDLPGDWGKRQLLIFEKTKTLPREFPRKVGEPKKEPL